MSGTEIGYLLEGWGVRRGADPSWVMQSPASREWHLERRNGRVVRVDRPEPGSALTTGFAELDAAVQAQLAVLTGALNGSGLPAPTLRPMQQRATNISFISSSMARDARAVMA